MKIRLRLILPIAVGLISFVLMVSSYMRPNHMHDPAWIKADIQACFAINGPVSVIRGLLFLAAKHIAPAATSYFWPIYAVYMLLIIALWYAAGYELDFRQRNQGSAILNKMRYRSGLDIIFVILGVLSLLGGIGARREFRHMISATYGNVLSIPYFLWAIALVGFYGHDFYMSLTGRHR